MRTAINVEEIKRKIDYASLAQEIVTQSQAGGLQRQNPVAVLLDPVKDAIVTARQNKASVRALVRFFRQKGIPVSEASLRRYLRERTGDQNSRTPTRTRVRNANTSSPMGTTRKP